MDIIKTPKFENVRLLNKIGNKKAASGTLCLTATHLIFVDPEGSRETWILHSHISSLEKLPLTAAGAPLKIKCKTFQIVTFVIARERDCNDVHTALVKLSNREKLEDLYAFTYSSEDEKLTRSAGWALFDMQSEYSRMGVPNSEWRHSNVNVKYQICETYPSDLYMPANVSNAVIVGSSKFRSRGRLPAMTYYHKETKTAICRCSQPLAGLNARCSEDEAMIQAVLKTTPNSKYIYIVDTRPKINALANRAAGKGYENTDFYENVKFQFVGIENIHVMRQSLQKLTEVTCETTKPSMSTFLSGLESSGWFKHIKAILDTSVLIVKAVMEEKVSVIVHCSDGWDRTAQTCSLASIILDPYYRTIHGFQVLIEKEWLSFGHKFTDRCGFLQSEVKETSPVFLQFLECTWQLLEQFPFAFQFNERFLLSLHEHAYSCQFGTFLGNCERERKELRLPDRTYSLWGYMWQNISDYINPLYIEHNDSHLIPDTSPQNLKFWRSMYNRYDNDVQPRETVTDSVSSIIDNNDSLRDHIKLLQSRIEMFKTLLGAASHGPKNNKNSSDTQDRNCSTKACLDNPSPNNKVDANSPDEEREEVISGEETPRERGTDEATNSCTYSEFVQEISQHMKRQGITPQELFDELPPFAVEWKSARDVVQCSTCAVPIDFLIRKYHCWNCGEVFCKRCIDRQCKLPGHYSDNQVPVCKDCYKMLK